MSKFNFLEKEVQNVVVHKETLLQEEDSSYTNTMIGNLAHHNTNKILGVSSNKDSYELKFPFKVIIANGRNLPVTKRSFVRASTKLFEP